MAKEPDVVTISRDVFERAVGEAFAAFGLAQWNLFLMIKRGLLTPEEATKALRDLAEVCRRSGPLVKLAAPKYEEVLDQLQKALHQPQAN